MSEANQPQSDEFKELEQELVKTNPQVFKGIPADKKDAIIRTFTKVSMSVEHSSGPIPHPEHLERYNQIIPNGADRIMRMAEKQQEHRQELEKHAVQSQLKQSGRGQIFGLVIGISALAIGGTCAMFGNEISGSIIGAGGVTGLVSVFVIGKNRQRESLKRKNQ